MARASTAAGPYRPSSAVYVTGYVEIDPDALHEEGWHRHDECEDYGDDDGGGVEDPQVPDVVEDALLPALDQLHRQAHPDEPLRWRWCQQDPCRTLQLKVVSLS